MLLKERYQLYYMHVPKLIHFELIDSRTKFVNKMIFFYFIVRLTVRLLSIHFKLTLNMVRVVLSREVYTYYQDPHRYIASSSYIKLNNIVES